MRKFRVHSLAFGSAIHDAWDFFIMSDGTLVLMNEKGVNMAAYAAGQWMTILPESTS